MTRYSLFRYALRQGLRCGLTLRQARIDALAYAREPLPF